MINILLLSLGHGTSLLFPFLEALKKTKTRGRVIATDRDPCAAALQFSDKAYIVPGRNEPDFNSAIKQIIKREKITLVVPSADGDMIHFAKAKAEFEKTGVRVLVSDQKTIEITTDKLKFFNFCLENNIRVPKFYSAAELAGSRSAVKYPAFINDRFGQGSRFAHKLESQNDLLYFLKKIPNPIVSDYIAADEYSVDCFCDFDGQVISIVPRRRLLVCGGESFVTRTEKNKTIIGATLELLKKLKVIGPANIQCFFDGRDATFFEVNARFGGAVRSAFEAGAATPELLINLLKGKRIKPRLGKFKDRRLMLRYNDDLFINEKDLKKIARIN